MLVCIGVRVILLLGDFLSLQLSANHTADIERKLSREIPKQLCRSHRPIVHRRMLYPSPQQQKKDVQHTLTQTKAMRLKTPKRHTDEMRTPHSSQEC